MRFNCLPKPKWRQSHIAPIPCGKLFEATPDAKGDFECPFCLSAYNVKTHTPISESQLEFTMKAFTDYPFVELGDTPGQAAPWRECVIVGYDHDKYCTVKIMDKFLSVKTGYLRDKPDGTAVTHDQLVKAFRFSEGWLANLNDTEVSVELQDRTVVGSFVYRNGECLINDNLNCETFKISLSEVKDIQIRRWVSILPKSPFEQLKATFDALDINYLVESSDDENGHWDSLYIVSEEEKKSGKRDTKFFSYHQLFEFQNGQVASY